MSKTQCWNCFLTRVHDGFDRLTCFFCSSLHRAFEAVCVVSTWQEVVDRHVVGSEFGGACNTSDETRQTRTCAIGQSQNINRCFDSTGGDVDDTSESTLGHAIYSGFE